MKKILTVLFVFFLFKGYSQELKPTATDAVINVLVTNFNDVPRKGETVILESVKTKKTYSGITDAKGRFSLLIPKGSIYNIKYKDNLDDVEYDQFEIPESDKLITSELKLQFESSTSSKTFTLKNVHFDTGKSTLKPESYKALNELVELMKLKTTLVIEIGGHTDNVGTPESNQKLSEDRANTVRNYLISKGISATRVTSKGYGDTMPIASNSTEEGKTLNRRTEVKIIKE